MSLAGKWSKGVKPPEKLTVSQWSDRHRVLSSEASSEAGKWDTSRAEYQRGIMDAFSDSTIHTVVFMSSAQVGKTSILENIIGYFISYDPSPILLLQPTLEMAQTFSKDRLSPMVRDTELLREKLSDFKAKSSGNTILHKTFTGGHITMAGANSPASLASRPIRVVLADEVDRYPMSAGEEGDPLSLAYKRTTTFWNKKRMAVSTPTVKGFSRIESAYNESDQRKFYVPCPHCETKQVLKWSHVQWDDGKPETAKYYCESCGAGWSDAERWNAVRYGEWLADNPTIKGVAGFWLNEIYSPWVKLSEMAKNFLEAKKSPHTLKTFVNTSLGETWEEQGDGVEDDALLARRETYELIPNDGLILTCGVDIQDDRIEGEIKAWGEDEQSWGIKTFVFYGRPSLPQVWEDLDAVIFDQYKREDGVKLKVSCTAIDSGGHFTEDVYRYAKKRELNRVFAVKGASTEGKPIISRPTTSNKLKVKLFSVGTDTAKELIYSRLQMDEVSNGYMHFNMDYDEEYFKQLTAEKIQTQYNKGFAKRVWVKTRPRNEALDITVYNLAALSILNPRFKAIKEKLEPADRDDGEAKPKKKRKSSRNGGFVNGWR